MDPPEFAEENPMDIGGFDEAEMNEGDELMDEADLFNSNEGMELDEDRRSDDGEKQQQQQFITVNRDVIDLESVIQNFKANALIIRLNYIADACPPLCADALRALLDYLRKESQNTTMYSTVYQKIESYRANGKLRDGEVFPPIDQEWIDQTTQRANSRLDTLNAEFRRQKDEGVKESIRRAMNDVFNQHLAMGNLDEALKLYSRGIREYCTQPGNLIEMLLNWITATVYAEQWSKLAILLPQVDRAVSEVQERDIPSASIQNSQRGGPSTSNTKSARNARELVASSTAKVAAVAGLNFMKRGDFKNAAQRFISIELESFNYPELLSQNDVAVYGAICALATYDRNSLKTDVLGSSQFRKFLESEPKLIELLQKFCRNQFGVSLDILAELRDQLLLNVYLAPHVPNLYSCIRRRAIVQFFQPYVTAGMVMMAEEFRTTVDELEEELVDLIRSGLLSARIDAHKQIVEAKVVDRRSEVFDRSLKASKAVDSLARTLLIRATLQELKCIVGLESNSRQKSSCSKIF